MIIKLETVYVAMQFPRGHVKKHAKATIMSWEADYPSYSLKLMICMLSGTDFATLKRNRVRSWLALTAGFRLQYSVRSAFPIGVPTGFLNILK